MNTLPLIVLSSLVLLEQCFAIPPYPLKRRVEVKGPDGSDLSIFLTGDALTARFETEDGYTMVEDPDSKGHWIYLREDKDFTWKDSTQTPPKKHLLPKSARDRLKRVRMAKKLAGAEGQSWELPDSSSDSRASGQRSVLVVAINFRDSRLALDEDAYWRMAFGESASLRSFYGRSSYGKLDLVPARETCGGKSDDGIAIVDLEQPQPAADTTEDDGLGNNFTTEALKRLSPCVDFASYDKDSDGVLAPDELSIVFILPGREGAMACDSDKCHKTWAKYRYFGPLNQLSVGDKKVTSATYIAELGDCECSRQNYYGVLCHEFAHSLGLPSLRSERGSDDSTLMKAGGWCTPGPCDFDPWSKAYLGWTRPRSISGDSENVDAELTERGTSPETDLIKVERGGGSMLLIEKRPGELGPSVWQVKLSEGAPVVRLVARDVVRWTHSSRGNPEGSRCVNFEVRGSSQLGKTLLLRFNDPKIACQTSIGVIQEDQPTDDTLSALNTEVASVVNATGMFNSQNTLFVELPRKKVSKTHLKHKGIPEPSPLLPISEKGKVSHQKLKTRATNEEIRKTINVRETGDNNCRECNGGSCCNNDNNCCFCCCCCCCGCKSCDKCSKYKNKADFYWKCDETKCIPYNDEDDAPVPEDCFDDGSFQSLSDSSLKQSSSSSSSSSKSYSSSHSSTYSSSSSTTDPQDLSESEMSSEESDSDYASSSYGSEEENVMICSDFTYELLQGRNCLSSTEKSSLYEESTHVRQSSSRPSSGSSGSSGSRNGKGKNAAVTAAAMTDRWLFVFFALLLFVI